MVRSLTEKYFATNKSSFGKSRIPMFCNRRPMRGLWDRIYRVHIGFGSENYMRFQCAFNPLSTGVITLMQPSAVCAWVKLGVRTVCDVIQHESPMKNKEAVWPNHEVFRDAFGPGVHGGDRIQVGDSFVFFISLFIYIPCLSRLVDVSVPWGRQ